MSVPVTLSPTGRVALVTPAGELDVADAPALRRALRAASGSGVALVVVDLARVTFVDSTVLGVLLEAHRALAQPRRLVVAGAQGLPLRTLQLTGLDTVLQVVAPRTPLDPELEGALREVYAG